MGDNDLGGLMHWVMGPLALLAGSVLLVASCRAPSIDSRAFLLQPLDADVISAADQVTDAVFSQLQAGGALAEGYPVLGHMVMEPDPSDPGAKMMSCAPGSSGGAGETRCVLLSEEADFIRVQAITWQSEAAFMYRIYVAPRWFFPRMDPAKDFVALDVFGPENTALWQPADQAIRSAAAELGARALRP